MNIQDFIQFSGRDQFGDIEMRMTDLAIEFVIDGLKLGVTKERDFEKLASLVILIKQLEDVKTKADK